LPYDLLIGSNANEWYMYVDDDPASLMKALAEMPPAAARLHGYWTWAHESSRSLRPIRRCVGEWPTNCIRGGRNDAVDGPH